MMKEIEDKLEKLISESDNQPLMDAWLEYLKKKNESAERLAKRLEEKDPVLLGGIVGAFIGSLFVR